MATTEALIAVLQLQIGALTEEIEKLSPGAIQRIRERAIEIGRQQGETAAAAFLANRLEQDQMVSTLNVEG